MSWKCNPSYKTECSLSKEQKIHIGTLLKIAIVLHFIWGLVVLPHIVTWGDPGWYSYNALDLHYGRTFGSNQEIDAYFDADTPLWSFMTGEGGAPLPGSLLPGQ